MSGTPAAERDPTELVELEASAAELLSLAKERARLAREFKEAARDLAERRERVVGDHGLERFDEEHRQLIRGLTHRLRPIVDELAAVAALGDVIFPRFDAAVRALARSLTDRTLPAERVSEAESDLDGILQLLPRLAVPAAADRAALAFGDGLGDAELRAVQAEHARLLKRLDDQADVLLRLGEDLSRLYGREGPGPEAFHRPVTAPELLAAEAAFARWSATLRRWAEAAHEYMVAAEAARERVRGHRPLDGTTARQLLVKTLSTATPRLLAVSDEFVLGVGEVDLAARALSAQLTNGRLSGEDSRVATHFLRQLGQLSTDATGEALSWGDDPELAALLPEAAAALSRIDAQSTTIVSWQQLAPAASG